MDYIEFKYLVGRMRMYQKQYFASRNAGILVKAKKAEKLVDDVLLPNLFNNER